MNWGTEGGNGEHFWLEGCMSVLAWDMTLGGGHSPRRGTQPLGETHPDVRNLYPLAPVLTKEGVQGDGRGVC